MQMGLLESSDNNINQLNLRMPVSVFNYDTDDFSLHILMNQNISRS